MASLIADFPDIGCGRVPARTRRGLEKLAIAA
jgi:hypothetical protein